MEPNSALSTSKRAPSKKAAAATPAMKSTPKRKSKAAPMAVASQEDLSQMIATAAYYLAAKRDFSPGHEMEDWLTAEKQVLGLIRQGA